MSYDEERHRGCAARQISFTQRADSSGGQQQQRIGLDPFSEMKENPFDGD